MDNASCKRCCLRQPPARSKPAAWGRWLGRVYFCRFLIIKQRNTSLQRTRRWGSSTEWCSSPSWLTWWGKNHPAVPPCGGRLCRRRVMGVGVGCSAGCDGWPCPVPSVPRAVLASAAGFGNRRWIGGGFSPLRIARFSSTLPMTVRLKIDQPPLWLCPALFTPHFCSRWEQSQSSAPASSGTIAATAPAAEPPDTRGSPCDCASRRGGQAGGGRSLRWSELQPPGVWGLRRCQSQAPCVCSRAGRAGVEIARAALGKGPVPQESRLGGV